MDDLNARFVSLLKKPPMPDHFHTGFDASKIFFTDIYQKKVWIHHTVSAPLNVVQFSNTGAWGGGGTSNAFTVTGVLSTDIISAVIRASTTAVSIQKAVPTTDTITVTFSADPGASTTVDFLVSRTFNGFGVFFIVPFTCIVTQIREVHQTLGTDTGAVTLTIEKLTGTQALDAGVSTMSGSFNLKGTINTVLTATLTGTLANRNLAIGNRLAMNDAGTLTAVANVTVFIELQLT